MIRGRFRRHGRREDTQAAEDEYFEIDPGELTGIFSVPSWLRDVGLMAWLLVGVAVFLVGMVWLLGLTEVIVAPVITAAVVAAVASPLVRWMHGHRIPRPIGAALLLVGMILIGIGVTVTIVAGITGEASAVTGHLDDAKNTISGWLQDIGMDPAKADDATKHASSTTSDAVNALLNGLATSVTKLSSLVFFLAMTALSLFFLLSDGPKIRAWAERHAGVPLPLAETISHRVLQALRGYFLGVTIVAAFNAIVVAVGCVIFGVPLIGTISAVTFLGAYVPYLGAWGAGAFAVLIALGNGGTDAAAGMIAVELLANSILQQLVQPFAMGRGAGHPPPGGADRDDRRRRPLRRGRSHPRRASDRGRHPYLRRPRARPGGRVACA
jgi:putative heme transporter